MDSSSRSSSQPAAKAKENPGAKVKVVDVSNTDRKNRAAVFKRLLSLSRPELLRIVMGISALIVNSLTNLSFPWIMGQAIDRATAGSSDAAALLASGGGLLAGVSREYLLFLAQAAGVFACGSLASWVRVYCLGTSTDRIAYRLRRALFDGYMDKRIEFFDTARTGEMVTVLEKDTVTAAQTLTDKLANGVRALNSCLNGSVLLFGISPRLCGVALGIVPFVGVGAMAIHRFAKRMADRLRRTESETLSYVMERLNNITTVRLNGQEDNEKSRYVAAAAECESVASSSYSAQGGLLSFIGFATNISLMSILFVGGGMLGKKEMTPGTLTRFAIQSAFVGLGFSGLSTFYSDMLKSVDAAGRVFQQIDANAAEAAVADAEEKVMETGLAQVAGGVDRSVCIRGVSFAYATRPDKKVLADFSLTVAPNSFTCIVGKSGVGKSTLLGLVSGLLTPSAGSISIGGTVVNDPAVDVRTRRKWLAANVGVVEQGGAGLLSGSIFDNIVYGFCHHTPTATADGVSSSQAAPEELRERVQQAARDASAHEFISTFPDGYDTMIGEGGKMLSGGQRARIVIARALVKRPVVLLLDEATAALDHANEVEILSVLTALVRSQKHTIIAFTHSEAMMQAADTVHVVEVEEGGGEGGECNGAPGGCCRIVESGSYEKLLSGAGAGAGAGARVPPVSVGHADENPAGSPLARHLQYFRQKLV